MAEKLDEQQRREADRDHKSREEMPEDAFLDGPSRKYPVKEKKDGSWVYSRRLLEAAASEARMHGHKELAERADGIRKREFAQDGMGYMVLALDRSSRTVDVDGRLHVTACNISKAVVNPYIGHEIPDYEGLGLEAGKTYHLLRDPKELEKAAPSFNNIPLLNRHIPVTADAPQAHAVVGSTGTDAEFIAPYLKNSLVIWDASAISGVNSGQQKELSCAYRYIPVMAAGEYEGMHYDGVMTQIVGNHVALVESGRAGSDVVVSDFNPFNTELDMSKASRKAIAVRAALGAYLRPRLAQDAAIGDLGALLRDVKAADPEGIAAAVAVALKGKFAKDAEPDEKEMKDVVEKASQDAEEPKPPEKAEDDDDEEEKKKEEKREGEDAEEDEGEEDYDDADYPDRTRLFSQDKGRWVPQGFMEGGKFHPIRGSGGYSGKRAGDRAMDSAISTAVSAAERRVVERMNALRTAENEVRPLLGDIGAMDSAEAVYRLALKRLGVSVEGVHPSALRPMFNALNREPKKPNVAQDAKNGIDSFKAMFPTAVIPGRS